MKEKGMGWLSKGQLGKLFRRDNLIILVLSGVLLFIIALPTKDAAPADGEEGKSQGTTEQRGLDFISSDTWGSGGGTEGLAGNTASGMTGSRTGDMRAYSSEYSYALYLEERLEKILTGVSGVGTVSVMITLESSEELIVEKDKPQTYSDIKETDAQGGERITSQTDIQENTIYSTAGSDSAPYVVMRMLPRVEGVLVVAQGAGNGTVNKSITEMIQALFDVEAHKIKVVKMAASN